jgi:hypothetical protein
MIRRSWVSYLPRAALPPGAAVEFPVRNLAGQQNRGALVTEIVLISFAVMAIAVVIGALVGRLGDLDDLGTMREMVDRSS